jgi:hypothetical protein
MPWTSGVQATWKTILAGHRLRLWPSSSTFVTLSLKSVAARNQQRACRMNPLRIELSALAAKRLCRVIIDLQERLIFKISESSATMNLQK